MFLRIGNLYINEKCIHSVNMDATEYNQGKVEQVIIIYVSAVSGEFEYVRDNSNSRSLQTIILRHDQVDAARDALRSYLNKRTTHHVELPGTVNLQR